MIRSFIGSAVAAVVLAVALSGTASAAIIGQWTNPQPEYPWQSGWLTGHTMDIPLTVPSGYTATITDWAAVGLSNWNTFDLTLTGTVVGDASAPLGSAIGVVSGNNLAPFVAVADPSDLVLPAGSYTISVVGQTFTPGIGDGQWAALTDIMVNGSLNAVPEPAAVSLLALGGLALLHRRRR